MVRFLFAILFALAAGAAPAVAQTQPKAAPGQPAPRQPAPKQSAPQQPPPSWIVNCSNTKDGMDCRAIFALAMKQTGQRLLSLIVRLPPKSDSPTLLIQLPHGLFLPAGAVLQVDKRPERKVEIQSCDKNGCYAGDALAAAELTEMQKGQTMRVAIQNLQKRTVNIEVPLAGFAAAYEKLK